VAQRASWRCGADGKGFEDTPADDRRLGTTNLTGKLTQRGRSRRPRDVQLNPNFFTTNDYTGLTTLNAGITTINSSSALGERARTGPVVQQRRDAQTRHHHSPSRSPDWLRVGGDVPGNLNGALATGGSTTDRPDRAGRDAAIGNVSPAPHGQYQPGALNGQTLVINNAGTARSTPRSRTGSAAAAAWWSTAP